MLHAESQWLLPNADCNENPGTRSVNAYYADNFGFCD